MVVELRNIHFPVDPVVTTMLNSNGQIATVIKAAEFWRSYTSFMSRTGFRLRDLELVLATKFRGGTATCALTFFKDRFSRHSNACLLVVENWWISHNLLRFWSSFLREVSEAGVLIFLEVSCLYGSKSTLHHQPLTWLSWASPRNSWPALGLFSADFAFMKTTEIL